MANRDDDIIKVCARLEEQALDVLRNPEYDHLPLEYRIVLYEDERRAVKSIRPMFPHIGSAINQIIAEYDANGKLEGHKLFERFSSKLPEYLR